jgi:alpha-tubulin suppressor-like RCC1 family protein
VALDQQGRVFAWGENKNHQVDSSKDIEVLQPRRKAELEHIVAITCGGEHSLALSREGKVYGWGNGQVWQLGETKWREGHTQAPKSRGKARQVLGMTGITAVKTLIDSSFALDQEGQVWGWGKQIPDYQRKVRRPVKLDDRCFTRVIAIASSRSFLLGYAAMGKLLITIVSMPPSDPTFRNRF